MATETESERRIFKRTPAPEGEIRAEVVLATGFRIRGTAIDTSAAGARIIAKTDVVKSGMFGYITLFPAEGKPTKRRCRIRHIHHDGFGVGYF